MRRKRWRIPRRPDVPRTDVKPTVLRKPLPKATDFLLLLDGYRRWVEASKVTSASLVSIENPRESEITAINRLEQKLKAIEDEKRRRWRSIERKRVAAEKELRQVLGGDYSKVVQAFLSGTPNTNDVSTCGTAIEEWSAPANKSWNLDGSSLVTIRPNSEYSHFDVQLQLVGTGIQNQYYVPIFPEDDDYQWSCLAVDATIRVTGLADTSSGGHVFIRTAQTMTHYRNQPWNPGPPPSWFRPPDEGSPIYGAFCSSQEATDASGGFHRIPPFEHNVSFVSHDVRSGDFFEFIQWVNIIAVSSVADFTGWGGVSLGKPYFRLFGR